MANKLPTMKQIRKWAKDNGWRIEQAYMCPHRWYLIREIPLPRAAPIVMQTQDEPLLRFKRGCAAIMDADGYDWRNAK